MKKIYYYSIKAFIDNKNGGNNAAVIPIIDEHNPLKNQLEFYLNKRSINDDIMLKIAKLIGYSETAFVYLDNKSMNNNNYKGKEFYVRFFTPEKEINYCGHATLGVFYTLKYLNIIKEGTYFEKTNTINIEINMEKKNTIFISQSLPKVNKYLGYEEIYTLIKNIDKAGSKNIFIEKFKPIIINTGLTDIIIPVRDRKTLNKLKPDFNNMKIFQKKYNLDGIHLFTTDIKNKKVFYARNFSPLLGINEEPATGSASGSLICYLYINKIIDKFTAEIGIIIFQGEAMGKRSKIKTKLKIDKQNFSPDSITKVSVGGECIMEEKSYVKL